MVLTTDSDCCQLQRAGISSLVINTHCKLTPSASQPRHHPHNDTHHPIQLSISIIMSTNPMPLHGTPLHSNLHGACSEVSCSSGLGTTESPAPKNTSPNQTHYAKCLPVLIAFGTKTASAVPNNTQPAVSIRHHRHTPTHIFQHNEHMEAPPPHTHTCVTATRVSVSLHEQANRNCQL